MPLNIYLLTYLLTVELEHKPFKQVSTAADRQTLSAMRCITPIACYTKLNAERDQQATVVGQLLTTLAMSTYRGERNLI